jgi:hypothetical protein
MIVGLRKHMRSNDLDPLRQHRQAHELLLMACLIKDFNEFDLLLNFRLV